MQTRLLAPGPGILTLLSRIRMGLRGLGWSPLPAGVLLLAFAAPLLALGTGKPLWEYGHQSWQSDSGLPQNTVHSVVQTRDGFLWIGTEAGLVRFDGTEFRVFDQGNTPALGSDLIRALVEDPSGALWAATPAGLTSELHGAFRSYGPGDGLPSSNVFGVFVTHRGTLVALTPAGAAVLRQGRFAVLPGTRELAMAEGSSLITENGQGEIAVAGTQGVIAFADSGKDVLRAAGDLAAIPEIGEAQALAIASDGGLWVGGANGLVVIQGGKRKRLSAQGVTSLLAEPGGGMWVGTGKGLSLERGEATASFELAGTRVDNLYLDHGGTLWIATVDGVARIVGGRMERAGPRPLIRGVLTMYEDREGNMWFGTDTAGLHILRQQPFSTITMEEGLSSGVVRAVFEDHAGAVWAGTSGGLDRLKDGAAVAFTGRLPSRVVLALADTGSALWAGTPEGLVRIRSGESRLFTTADGLADDFVRSLYADRDGSLWIGTRHGLSHWQNGRFRSYSTLDGLSSDLIGTILRRRNGELWVGTLGGLSRMSGDTFADAIPGSHGAITALLEDERGTLWIGANGDGLSELRGSVLKRFPFDSARAGGSETSLPGTIYGMLEDASGCLWLGSREGIFRVSIAALNHVGPAGGGKLPVVRYGSADGLRIPEASGGGHPAAWRSRDGTLWFAMIDGAAAVDPSASLLNTVSPLTAIEQVLVDDQPAPLSASLRIPPGHGRLAVQYAGLSFVAPAKVRYRYKLDGFDKGWIEAGARRTAFYTNVPPGRYRFLVLSANNDGLWGRVPAEIDVTVEPFFYQTAWFYALAALALAGVGYLAYRWRVHTVEAQYGAVLGERSRIAREIHDTLAQGYVAIAVQIELAERLLTSSTEAAAEQLQATKALVREGLEEARSSIWNLRAQSEAETLPAQLAAFLRRPGQSGISVRFAVHGSYRPLDRGMEREILRIAQEAVANARAHARPTRIVVSLTYAVQELTLRVSDDGVGLQPAGEERRHFGIQGMRERAARIHAMLDIASGPERSARPGAAVTLRVDLRRAGKEERG